MPVNDILTIGDMNLEYRIIESLETSQRTIVMLHEGLGCIRLWYDFPERLAAATGWRVVVYSRIGYGGSSPCTLPRSVSYMHDEAQKVLPAFLDRIGFASGVLLGHSDGASISAIYAGTHDDERLHGLILIAPHFFIETVGLAAIESARLAFIEGDLRSRLARYHGKNVDCAFWGWCDAWLDPAFRTWDIRSYLPRITQPILGLQGDHDEYGTLDQLATLERHCRAPVKRLVLSGCRHAPHLEQPEKTLTGIRALIQDLD